MKCFLLVWFYRLLVRLFVQWKCERDSLNNQSIGHVNKQQQWNPLDSTANCSIFRLKVAENSSVCRSVRIWPKIERISNKNGMSRVHWVWFVTFFESHCKHAIGFVKHNKRNTGSVHCINQTNSMCKKPHFKHQHHCNNPIIAQTSSNRSRFARFLPSIRSIRRPGVAIAYSMPLFSAFFCCQFCPP